MRRGLRLGTPALDCPRLSVQLVRMVVQSLAFGVALHCPCLNAGMKCLLAQQFGTFSLAAAARYFLGHFSALLTPQLRSRVPTIQTMPRDWLEK